MSKNKPTVGISTLPSMVMVGAMIPFLMKQIFGGNKMFGDDSLDSKDVLKTTIETLVEVRDKKIEELKCEIDELKKDKKEEEKEETSYPADSSLGLGPIAFPKDKPKRKGKKRGPKPNKKRHEKYERAAKWVKKGMVKRRALQKVLKRPVTGPDYQTLNRYL